MNTPISQSPPAPSGPGVWIPLALADALFKCYYGDGPRSHERNVSPPIPPAMKGGDPNEDVPPLRNAVAYDAFPRGARPQGVLRTHPLVSRMMGGDQPPSTAKKE